MEFRPRLRFNFQLQGSNSCKMTIQSSVERKYRKSPRAPLLPQAQSQKHDNLEAHEAGIDGASFSGAVFNLSTTIVGAGIMALPATVKELGLIPGLIIIVLVGWLTESSIDMIMRFSRASKSATYSGVVADAFGGAGRTLLQVCIVVNNLGMLVVYMIIIGNISSFFFSYLVNYELNSQLYL